MRRTIVAGLAAAPLLAACIVVQAPPAAPPEPARTVSRVDIDVPSPMNVAGVHTIVMLKDPRERVDDPAMLRRLSSAARAEISPVREMSGNAFVVAVRAEPGAAYEAALARLRSSGLVEYAEPEQQVRVTPPR
jgi:hypothetical protein